MKEAAFAPVKEIYIHIYICLVAYLINIKILITFRGAPVAEMLDKHGSEVGI